MATSRHLNQSQIFPAEGNGITTIHLKAFLQELIDHPSNVCVRMRLIGKMWMPNFMRPVRMSGKGIILFDETTMEYEIVHDLRDVMQLEIDAPYKDVQPYFHYEVRPTFQ